MCGNVMIEGGEDEMQQAALALRAPLWGLVGGSGLSIVMFISYYS